LRDLASPSRAAAVFEWGGQEYNVHYLPAQSDTGMFGGDSNWRWPIWFPMNLIICAAYHSCTATTATRSRSCAAARA
jgi:hypothetical protein